MTVIQMGRKHCGKRRNCSFRAISPFPTVFQKGLFPRGVKGVIVWEWVNMDGRMDKAKTVYPVFFEVGRIIIEQRKVQATLDFTSMQADLALHCPQNKFMVANGTITVNKKSKF